MSVVERERGAQIPPPEPLTIRAPIEEREADEVALAAIWMDVEYPGWASRIDTDKLNVDHCPTCIIGQAASEDDWGRLFSEHRLGEYLRGCAPTGLAPFSNNRSKPYWLNEIAKRA